MPSVSKKQHNFFAAVANNPKFAKKAGVPQSVGEEFLKADKGRKFRQGGAMSKAKRYNDGGAVGTYPFPQTGGGSGPASTTTVNVGGQPVDNSVPSTNPFAPVMTMKKGGKVSASRRGDGIVQRGKTRGRMV